MTILFGWNSLKVRSFTLSEIGITNQNEAGLEFEVRQAYFHIFAIPFFPLDKRWVVHKGGNMYEMPGEIQALAERSLTGVRTPWYTFIGPILLLTAGIIFSVITARENNEKHKQDAAIFRETANALTARLQHLTTNDFITIEDRSNRSHPVSFLKIEDIKGDQITVTRVESDKHQPMMVEKEYTRLAGASPSVKISYKQLLRAFPKELDSLQGHAMDRQAAYLFNDDKLYIVKDVVRHFMPAIKAIWTSIHSYGIGIRLYNEGWPATITQIENLDGFIDWSHMINKRIPTAEHEFSYFELEGTNIRKGDSYKFVMTVKDTTGRLYKYELDDPGNEKITIREL